MKNKIKNIMILVICIALTFSNTILAIDLKDGEVAFSKSAEWMNKDEGIAKITLSIEAKPVSKPSDVILVVDRSGSMDFSSSIFLDKHLSGEDGVYSVCMREDHYIDGKHFLDGKIKTKQDRYSIDKGCMTRYDVAKTAVSNFLDNFYSREDNNDSRVALVTFNSDTDDIKEIFSPNTILSNQNFTNDKNTILSTMENLVDKLDGGTNYTNALKKAEEFIKNRNKKENKDGNENINSRPTYVVFLTDGIPDPIENDGKNVASTLKQNGAIIYTIGIGKNVDTKIIEKLSSSENVEDGYFTTTSSAKDLIEFYSNIANNIKNAGVDLSLEDVIGDDFEYFEDEMHLPTATPTLYPKDSEDGKTIKWYKKEITDPYKSYEFYIKLKDNDKNGTGTWNTNNRASISFIDINNEEKSLTADVPKLSRNKYVVEHYLENDDGTYTINNEATEKYLTDVGKKVVGVPKDFDGYKFSKDVSGNVLETFVEEDKEAVLKLYYNKNRSKVIVRYIDENGVDLIDKIEMDGIIGKEYNTEIKDIDGYELNKLPENKDGKYLEENQEVIYEYKKVSGKVIVEYIDLMGNKLLDDDIYIGYVNDEYKVNRKDIQGYIKYGSDPKNISGKYIDGEILVTYVYDKINIENSSNLNDNANVNTSDIDITSYVILMLVSFVAIGFLIYKIRKLNSK